MVCLKSARPKRLPLPKKEKAIGRRLRAVREYLKLSQTNFSEQVGISRERLATYEEGRAPLPSDIGLRICRIFFLSEAWLATGQLEFSSPQGISNGISRLCMGLELEPIARQIKPGLRFSVAFDCLLKETYYKLLMEYFPAPRLALLPSDKTETFQNVLLGSLSYYSDLLPGELQMRLYTNLILGAALIWRDLAQLDGFDDEHLKTITTDFEKEIESRIKKLFTK